MKILLINSVCGVGSTGRVVESLYKHFKNAGNDVKIAYGRNKYDKIPAEDQYCFYNKCNIYFHALMSRICDKAGLDWSKKATKNLIGFIEDFKPDIVNLHNLHGYYLNVPMLLQYLGEKNIKCVFTLHDCWLFTGHCTNFHYNNCQAYKDDCLNCKNEKCYPKSLGCARAHKNLKVKKDLINGIKHKTFIAPSQWLKNFASQSSVLKKENIDVVYNKVDDSIFNLNAKLYYSKEILPTKKYILCIANYWNEQKGLNKVVELSKNLDSEHCILMIGNLKDKSILNENIVYKQQTNNAKELAYYYANAEVFYNPTFEDIFGLVTLEALLCGTPVVLFKGCSGGEEFIDETNGVVIDKNMSAINVMNEIKKASQLKAHQIKINREIKFFKEYEEVFNKLTKEG